jgi:malate dehydrogenase (oxaloacetate-decarboxylating)
MSNPTELAEATAGDLLTWTDGRALVATGSPSPEVTIGGLTFTVAQANNALVFPGIGLGTVVSRARRVTDGMLAAAAHAVAGWARPDLPGSPLLPEITDVRAVTVAVAAQVAKAAEADGVARVVEDDWDAAVVAAMWEPIYPTVLPVDASEPAEASEEALTPG